MRTFRLRAPSPALVISVVALVIALGGTSYAFFLPNGSVGSKQLKNRAVTNAKLGPNSVGPAKIMPGAVNASKINMSGLTVPNAATAGTANALNGVQVVSAGPFTNTPGSQNYGQSNCPTNTHVIAGGVYRSRSWHRPVGELILADAYRHNKPAAERLGRLGEQQQHDQPPPRSTSTRSAPRRT